MTAPAIAISRSGILAREFCRRHARAEVAAVFDRSLYLRAGDDFICLGEPSIGNGPLTLITDFGSIDKVSDRALRSGQSAIISQREIVIADVARLLIDQSSPWRPLPWPAARSRHDLAAVCRDLSRLALAKAPEDGLGRLFDAVGVRPIDTPLARIARPRLARFRSWLRDLLDVDHAWVAASFEPVRGLIGLGPGLTPSGDDFLVGALALLDALEERNAHAALARAINLAPRGLTSPLSDCLLRSTAAGHVGENLHRAASATISGTIRSAVAAVRSIGHSSGWDMMAGIATALQVVLNRPVADPSVAWRSNGFTKMAG
jgi:uncharacterized protein DUF2877